MISPGQEIRITGGKEELYREAAAEFIRLSRDAVELKGLFTVALSGGSTPAGLFELLADEKDSFRGHLPWQETHFFFGDERHAGPEDPGSNFFMAHSSMLSKVPVPESNVHRIEGENPDAYAAARDYEKVLIRAFRLKNRQLPRFDLVLLGMGADGHTASLFPGTGVLSERERLVGAVRLESTGTYRITLTPPVLCHAACIIFLVSGKEKAEALRSVLQGDFRPEKFPAQLVRPHNGRILWIVDSGAAGLLNGGREGERNRRNDDTRRE